MGKIDPRVPGQRFNRSVLPKEPEKEEKNDEATGLGWEHEPEAKKEETEEEARIRRTTCRVCGKRYEYSCEIGGYGEKDGLWCRHDGDVVSIDSQNVMTQQDRRRVEGNLKRDEVAVKKDGMIYILGKNK